jgi:hypothetical protein
MVFCEMFYQILFEEDNVLMYLVTKELIAIANEEYINAQSICELL